MKKVVVLGLDFYGKDGALVLMRGDLAENTVQ
jgi:hypothetical protein